jgi:hypothetical protein
MRPVDRFVVFNVGATKAVERGYGKTPSCSRRTFTSYGDAAKATLRCSRQGKLKGASSTASEPCFLLHGMPGSEKLVGRCFKGKCGRPEDGDRAKMDRCKLDKKQRAAKRKETIRERVIAADRARGMSPSKASKSGVFAREDLPAELKGYSTRRRTKKRER